MKRIHRAFCCLMAAVLLLGTVPALAAGSGLGNFTRQRSYSGQFADVSAGVWYYDSVASAYELGLVSGRSATAFAPGGYIKLGEAVALACRVHSTYRGTSPDFSGTGGAWYDPYVQYAVRNGIIRSGEYGDYSAFASREQFASIFAAALPETELSAINHIPDDGIPDVAMTSIYARAIYRLYRAGVLTGNDGYGTFDPMSEIKRSEVAAILIRLVQPGMRRRISLINPVYEGYRRVVEQKEARYGLGYTLLSDYGSEIRGVGIIRLMDMNGDGVQELILGYCADSSRMDYCAEIWTWDGAPKWLGTWQRPLSRGGTGFLLGLTPIDGEWTLITGEMQAEYNLRFLALRNGSMQEVHSLYMEWLEENGTCIIDGVRYGSAQANQISRQWLSGAILLGFNVDGISAFEGTPQTRYQLGLS